VTVLVLTIVIGALILGGVILLARLPSFLERRRNADD
jgi:hypothetical protein